MKVTGPQHPRTSDISAGKTREQESSKGKIEKGAALRGKDTAVRGNETANSERPAGNHTSLTMNRIREVIKSTPDVRSERVEALREQIRSGSYKVNADRLAESMLTEALREDLEKP